MRHHGLGIWVGLLLVGLADAATPGSDLRVLDARAPATSESSGVVYLSVHNTGGVNERLEGASTQVAKRVVIQTLTGTRNAPQRSVLAGVDLAIGGSLDFGSGVLQLQLVGLHRPLVMGQHFKLVLKFREAGVLTTTVQVMAAESQHPPLASP